MWLGEEWIERHRATKIFRSHVGISVAASRGMPEPSLVSFPGTEVRRGLSYGPLSLGLGDRRGNFRRHRYRDLILHDEHIRQFTVVAFRPDVDFGFGIDESGIDSDTLAIATHTAVKYVTDTEFTGDVPRAHFTGPEGET